MNDVIDTEIIWQDSGNPECLHSHAHALLHVEQAHRPQAMEYPTVDYDWMKQREGKRTRHCRAGHATPILRLVLLKKLPIRLMFKDTLWEKILEISCMLLKQPLPLHLDNGMAARFFLFSALLLLHLLLPFPLIERLLLLDKPLNLAFVHLDFHPTLLIVQLLDPVILCKLSHQLRPELFLFFTVHLLLLLFELHL